jgi:hypothetical protein
MTNQGTHLLPVTAPGEHRSVLSKFVLGILAAAGFVTFVITVHRVDPLASVDLRKSRAEILEEASSFLSSRGYTLKGLHQDGWFSLDAASHMYFQVREGIERANAILRADSLPTHHWFVWWYDAGVAKSQGQEQFYVWMSPGGRVLGYQHIIMDSVPRPSMDSAAAQALARSTLEREGVALEGFTLQTSTDIKLAHRTDHRFVWTRSDSTAELSVWVRIQGNEVGGFRLTFEPTGGFRKRLTEATTSYTLISVVSIAVVFLLILFIIALFLKKYHEGEVGTRTGAVVFFVVFAISVLEVLNRYYLVGAGTTIGDLNHFNIRLVELVFDIFIVQVFLSIMVFAGWCVGESSSRSVWGEKITSTDSVLFGKFFSLDLGRSIIRGYAWGLVLLGGYAAVTLYVTGRGNAIYAGNMSGIAESFVPGLQPVAVALKSAVFSEIVFRLFFMSYLREKTGKKWPGVLVATMLWTVAAVTMWDQPYGFFRPWLTFGMLFLVGLAMCLLFLRYDLVTTLIANFIVCSVALSVPLFVSSSDQAFTARIVFVLAVILPLPVGIVGVLRKRRFEFSPETMPAHIQRISERERMSRELEIARSVQMSLLPKANPVLSGFDIAGICIPALEVGGDYYDFVNLAGRRLGIAIGDVSGKGVPAAIYMTLTKGILQSHAEDNISPKNVLAKVNSLMYRTIERNSFVSMFYAVLDLDKRTIRFSRAGQCPLILTHHVEGKGRFLNPRGMALGLERGTIFESVLEEQELPLRSGEVLVFYTDGFTEAMNPDGEEFGEMRLGEAIAGHRNKSAEEIIKGVCDEVRAYTQGRPQHDDMTMVVLKVD